MTGFSHTYTCSMPFARKCLMIVALNFMTAVLHCDWCMPLHLIPNVIGVQCVLEIQTVFGAEGLVVRWGNNSPAPFQLPCLIRARNSSRVLGSSRKTPSIVLVKVRLFSFWTPLITMHMCLQGDGEFNYSSS